MTDRPDDLICVGAIAGAFGVRGDVRLKSFCVEARDIARYAPLTDEAGTRSFTVKITQAVKGGLAAKLGSVTTREQAEAMKGMRLYAPRGRMPAPADDEYYYSDLIGVAVFDTGGTRLGTVRVVDDFGGGDFLEIALESTGKPLLIPFTRDAVPTVDLTARRIIVDPPADVSEPE